MAELKSLDLLWHDVPEVFEKAFDADLRTYGTAKHGLRGTFCTQAGGLVTFGHHREPAIRAVQDLASLFASAIDHLANKGSWSESLATLQQLGKDITICGFAVPRTQRVQYLTWPYKGVTAVQFMHPQELRFGPRGQDPQTHHLLAYALKIEGVESIDRHQLDGAF